MWDTFHAAKETLPKHAYSNILKISPPKTENFQVKDADIFHISTQNIDSGYSLEPPRWGGSNEYPQSIFLSKKERKRWYPCKHSLSFIKVALRGSKLYMYVFLIGAWCKCKQIILSSQCAVMYYLFDSVYKEPFAFSFFFFFLFFFFKWRYFILIKYI